jgi:hypothetical protein
MYLSKRNDISNPFLTYLIFGEPLPYLIELMRCLLFISLVAGVVFSAELSDTMPRESSVSQGGAMGLVERATGATWMAAAKNPKNDKEIDETRKLLNETVVDKNRFITTFKSRNGNTYMWGGLTLDDAGVKKVRADPRIKYVEEEPVEVDDYVIPNYGEDDTSATWYEYDTKAKRAVDDWIKVDPAPKNLAIINQAP